MGTRNGLSGAIAAHNDDQPHSDGPWANAWAPVWEEAPSDLEAVQSHQADGVAAQSLDEQTSTSENASEDSEAEPIYA